jgi:hypothetical protein
MKYATFATVSRMDEKSGIIGYVNGVAIPMTKSELFGRLKRGHFVQIKTGTRSYLNRRRGAALARARKAGNHFQLLMDGLNESLNIHQEIESAREQRQVDIAFAKSVW